MRKLVAAFSVALLLSLVACSTTNNDAPIPDTPAAKAILDVFDRYQKAMEARDVDTIIALSSTRYYDKMGSPNPANDVTYRDLKEKLHQDFEQIKEVSLAIQVIRMSFEYDKETQALPTAKVRYSYELRYKTIMPAGEKWHSALDINKMAFVEEDGSWKIISGL